MSKPSARYRVADLIIDVGQRRVTRDAADVPLGRLTFELLVALIERAPEVVTQTELARRVWAGRVVTPATVGQRVKILRQSIGDDAHHPNFIRVLRGHGYQLIPSVERLDADALEGKSGDGNGRDNQTATFFDSYGKRSRNRGLAQRAGYVVAALLGGLMVGVTWDTVVSKVLSRQDSTAPAEHVPGVSRFSVTVPAAIRRRLGSAPQAVLAISPDARQIVFSAGDLTIRRLDRLGLRTIPATSDAHQPFFSPDGEWIAYFTDRQLKKVHVSGESAPLTLVDDVPTAAASFGIWREDGTIVYSTGDRSLSIVSADGGEPKKLDLVGDSGERVGGPMAVDAESGRLLLTFGRGPTDTRVELYDWATGARSVLLEDAWFAGLTSSNHILFIRDGLLMATSANLAEGTSGPVATVPIDIERDVVGVVRQFSISADGTLAYLVAANSGLQASELGWIEPNREFSPLITLPPLAGPRTLDFSPDFRSILTTGARNLEVVAHLIDVDGPVLRPQTFSTQSATWDRDGRRVALGGREGLRVWDTGNSTQTMLSAAIKDAHSIKFTPDGTGLIYMAPRPDKNIYRFDIANSEEELLFGSPANEFLPEISPDGRLIAYVSDESGEPVVNIARLDGVGHAVAVETSSYAPIWSPDGSELFFIASDTVQQQQLLRAARISHGDYAAIESYRTVLTTPDGRAERYRYVWGNSESAMYDVASNRDRFLVMRVPLNRTEDTPEVVIVQNWVEELAALVPPG